METTRYIFIPCIQNVNAVLDLPSSGTLKARYFKVKDL